MSNLIPETRVDRNGVAVTRHVRAHQQTSARTSMPAPKLTTSKGKPAARKRPTKAQLAPRYRVMNAERFGTVDPVLAASDGVQLGGGFTASDAEIYSVLSATDPATAIVLLQSGIRSAEETINALDKAGLDRLMDDHSVLMYEVLGRKISVERFLNSGITTDDQSEVRLDALEVASMDALFEFDYLPNDVKAGAIKLADIKAIGATRIKKSDCYTEVRDILTNLARGSAKYTPDDVKVIFDKYSPEGREIRNALTLTELYGSEFGTTVDPETYTMEYAFLLHRTGVEPERSVSVMKYALGLREAFRRTRTKSEYDMPSREDTIKFHDAGATYEDIINGLTVQQVDAIKNEGIASSVSGGWL